MSPPSAALTRAVAFDFDGTLVDSNAVKSEAFGVVLGNPAYTETLTTLRRRHPDWDRHRLFAETADAVGTSPTIAARWADAYGRYCEEKIRARIAAPAVTLLDALHRHGCVRALNTATPEDAIRQLLAGTLFDGRFDFVFGRPADKLENLRRLADRAGLGPDAITMVGDGDDDYDAAKRFGCRFIGMVQFANRFTVQPPERAHDFTDIAVRLGCR